MIDDNVLKCAEYVYNFIKEFDTPELALEVSCNIKVPRKYRCGKKLLCKMIRSYIYAKNVKI